MATVTQKTDALVFFFDLLGGVNTYQVDMLAHQLRYTHRETTAMINRAVDEGHITASFSDDKTCVTVCVTEKGRELSAKVYAGLFEPMCTWG